MNSRKDTRLIVPKEVTDEQVEQAEVILAERVDPNWNMADFGCMFIGVTGKYQVYYTLWKHAPRNMFNPVIYLGNLSMDIVEAAKKARKRGGIQPIFFENYETLKGMQGAQPEAITFGKYRGRTIGEVYSEDPQYIIWMSKNMQPRNKKQTEQLQLCQTLTDDFFRALGEKNKANETKEYFEIGQKFEGRVRIINISQIANDYSDLLDYKIKAETDKYRFVFKASIKNIAEAAGIKLEMERDIWSHTDHVKSEIMFNIIEIVKNIGEMEIAGKAKYNSEIVGKKWTRLSRVKITKLYEKRGIDF